MAIDGSRIENEGEAEINLLVKDGKGDGHNVRTTVQVADVARALWSVGVLCDAGLDPRFKAEHAKVYDSKGIEVCHFEHLGPFKCSSKSECKSAFEKCIDILGLLRMCVGKCVRKCV